MNLLPRLNLRRRLIAAFGTLLLALLGVGAFAYQQISQLDEVLRLTQGKEALLGRAQSALWELRYGFPQFLVLTDTENRRKITEAEPGLYKTLEDNLRAYGESPGLTAEEQAGHRATLAAWSAYKERRSTWFTLISEGRTEEAAAWRAQYTTPLGAATVRTFGQLIDTTARSDHARRSAQARLTEQSRTLVSVLAVAAALLGLLVAGLVLRSFTGSINRLLGLLQALRQGDYTRRCQLGGADELGQLGRQLDALLDERLESLNRQARESEQISNSVVEIMQAVGQVATQKDLSIKVPVTADVTGAIGDAMNMLTDETARVLGSVHEVSDDVSSAALQMKQSSDSLMNAAGHSREEIESAARELSQAALTLESLAAQARLANESAELAVSSTQQALRSVDRTVSGINDTRELIREIEKRIKRLGERSQEISQIVGIISSIADRTGLLALNASMQATAAGETGRGFALVAEEVKRLSENAREATREIGTLVGSIQSETSETVLAMNSAITQVVDVSRLADQAGTEMKGTQLATDELANQVRGIAHTSSEQARAGQSLQSRAQAIEQTARESSRQLAAQHDMATRLTQYAQSLVREVSVFKLPRRRA